MTDNNSGLTPAQLEIIRNILKTFASEIDEVCLFGSRAAGNYRDNSDIDMVLFGDITEENVDRLRTLFDESLLPFETDINAYHLITYAPLRHHIDQAQQSLFTKQDLMV